MLSMAEEAYICIWVYEIRQCSKDKQKIYFPKFPAIFQKY